MFLEEKWRGREGEREREREREGGGGGLIDEKVGKVHYHKLAKQIFMHLFRK